MQCRQQATLYTMLNRLLSSDAMEQKTEGYFHEELRTKQWETAYRNPWWGNEVLLIKRDEELWIAIIDMRVQRKKDVEFQVGSVLHMLSLLYLHLLGYCASGSFRRVCRYTDRERS
jgi:hypothetical protein